MTTGLEPNVWATTQTQDGGRRGPGRPKGIPEELFNTILQLYESGDGYRRITSYLQRVHGVSTTYTTIRRLVKGQGAYAGGPT